MRKRSAINWIPNKKKIWISIALFGVFFIRMLIGPNGLVYYLNRADIPYYGTLFTSSIVAGFCSYFLLSVFEAYKGRKKFK